MKGGIMNKVFIALVSIIALVFLFPLNTNADQSPKMFVETVKKLEAFVKSEGLELDADEEIKDVVTIAYLNALGVTRKSFGNTSDEIKQEMIDWLSIMCLLPGVPEEKKKDVKKKLKKARKALTKGAYERTIAEISIFPRFATTCKNELYIPEREYAKYVAFPSWDDASEIWKKAGFRQFSFKEMKTAINKDKVKYQSIINVDWVSAFLK